jgi:hypothetical protein
VRRSSQHIQQGKLHQVQPQQTDSKFQQQKGHTARQVNKPTRRSANKLAQQQSIPSSHDEMQAPLWRTPAKGAAKIKQQRHQPLLTNVKKLQQRPPKGRTCSKQNNKQSEQKNLSL